MRLVAQDHAKLHRDMGGPVASQQQGPPEAEPPPGYSTYGPPIGLQRPFGNYMPMGSLGGGYAKPLNMSNNPAMGAMMAMQKQPYAHGGAVDGDALARAHAMLFHAKRACGGRLEEPDRGSQRMSVLPRANGGSVDSDAFQREAKRLSALWARTERENPGLTTDKIFTLMCQKSPGVARLFRLMLQQGYSRSGIKSMIKGGLIRWADGE
jgi:hypothetical protein